MTRRARANRYLSNEGVNPFASHFPRQGKFRVCRLGCAKEAVRVGQPFHAYIAQKLCRSLQIKINLTLIWHKK